jgi:hypothetical protein
LEISAKVGILGQSWKSWPKLEILAKAGNLGQSWKSWPKLEISAKVGNLGQTSRHQVTQYPHVHPVFPISNLKYFKVTLASSIYTQQSTLGEIVNSQRDCQLSARLSTLSTFGEIGNS